MARAKKKKRNTARRRPPRKPRETIRRHLADVGLSADARLLLGEHKPILLRLPSNLLERVRELAKEDRRSINRWCELALANAANAA